jgi:hypothetical protein
MAYFRSKVMLARFVVDQLSLLKRGSALTTTIIPGQFGDFSASIVIGELLGATVSKVEPISYEQPTNTSQEPIQGG